MIFERVVSKVKYKTHLDELNKCKVEAADVAEVLGDMLNLPETNLPISLRHRLLHLNDNLLEES
jgi:uncharacterized protein (UPF0147 family)